MEVYSSPPWPRMTLQTIKFQRVVGCALYLREPANILEAIAPKELPSSFTNLTLLEQSFFSLCALENMVNEGMGAALPAREIPVNHCYSRSTHNALLAQQSWLRGCRKWCGESRKKKCCD